MEVRSVRLHNFKGLRDYRVTLKRMNVRVGSNNAGKSSILDAFRLLGAALRHARRHKSGMLSLDGTATFGWEVPPTTLPIPLVNIHHDPNPDIRDLPPARELPPFVHVGGNAGVERQTFSSGPLLYPLNPLPFAL